jgi:hypothetical protein
MALACLGLAWCASDFGTKQLALKDLAAAWSNNYICTPVSAYVCPDDLAPLHAVIACRMWVSSGIQGSINKLSFSHELRYKYHLKLGAFWYTVTGQAGICN